MTPKTSCPRCGYDLAGVVESWNHAESLSCPLNGTCSECGLGFEWADVFRSKDTEKPMTPWLMFWAVLGCTIAVIGVPWLIMLLLRTFLSSDAAVYD